MKQLMSRFTESYQPQRNEHNVILPFGDTNVEMIRVYIRYLRGSIISISKWKIYGKYTKCL